jgi:hypothetical protein
MPGVCSRIGALAVLIFRENGSPAANRLSLLAMDVPDEKAQKDAFLKADCRQFRVFPATRCGVFTTRDAAPRTRCEGICPRAGR